MHFVFILFNFSALTIILENSRAALCSCKCDHVHKTQSWVVVFVVRSSSINWRRATERISAKINHPSACVAINSLIKTNRLRAIVAEISWPHPFLTSFRGVNLFGPTIH